MEWGRIITYGIIGVVVALVMMYLNKSASKQIERAPGESLELRMNVFYPALGILSLLLALAVLIVAIYYNDRGVYIAGAFGILIFGSLGLIVLLWYKNHRVVFDEEQVSYTSWTGRKHTTKWKDIQHISYRHLSGYLKIEDANTHMSIHQHLVGLKMLIQMMEEKTQWTARELRIPFR